jgi:hypothetical protein
MTISSRRLRTFLVVLLAAHTGVLGCQTKHPSDKSLQLSSGKDFVVWLQDTLRNGDHGQVIAATKFPVQVDDTMMDEPTLTRNYDKVWNPETIKAVMNEVSSQFITGNKFIIGLRRDLVRENEGSAVQGHRLWPIRVRKRRHVHGRLLSRKRIRQTVADCDCE